LLNVETDTFEQLPLNQNLGSINLNSTSRSTSTKIETF